jgi:hypothetical protein
VKRLHVHVGVANLDQSIRRSIDEMALRSKLKDIGRIEGATGRALT